jgi:hypothetical protein
MIHIALPAMNEMELLPKTVDCIKNQAYKNYKVYLCINQPEEWWYNDEKRQVCENNHQTIDYLRNLKDPVLIILDKSSPGKGWKEGEGCAGLARKTVMDEINQVAAPDDIVLSMDADTTFNEYYFKSVLDSLENNPLATALTVPYYHPLTGDQITDRALLRYEIYLRCFALNMFRIASPYSFTALGSAMAIPVWAYRVVRGMTPKKSGEDFYFLQKLRKYGPIKLWNTEMVYPSGRPSDRVFFGTGPAIIKGTKGDWSSYPIYNYRHFEKIKRTIELFPYLYHQDLETPLTEFLKEQLHITDIWGPLRKNFRDQDHFVRACHERLDGLRILQFLKKEQKNESQTDEQNLEDFLSIFYGYPELRNYGIDLNEFLTSDSSVENLNAIRNFLFEKENICRMMADGNNGFI